MSYSTRDHSGLNTTFHLITARTSHFILKLKTPYCWTRLQFHSSTETISWANISLFFPAEIPCAAVSVHNISPMHCLCKKYSVVINDSRLYFSELSIWESRISVIIIPRCVSVLVVIDIKLCWHAAGVLSVTKMNNCVPELKLLTGCMFLVSCVGYDYITMHMRSYSFGL